MYLLCVVVSMWVTCAQLFCFSPCSSQVSVTLLYLQALIFLKLIPVAIFTAYLEVTNGCKLWLCILKFFGRSEKVHYRTKPRVCNTVELSEGPVSREAGCEERAVEALQPRLRCSLRGWEEGRAFSHYVLWNLDIFFLKKIVSHCLEQFSCFYSFL